LYSAAVNQIKKWLYNYDDPPPSSQVTPSLATEVVSF